MECKENGDKAPQFLSLGILVMLANYTGDWVEPRFCLDVAEKRKIPTTTNRNCSVGSHSLTVVN
jgi:hypothetical protein